MHRFAILSFLAVLTVAGCNVSTEGTQGKVAFTPLECGRFAGCDFADAIGVGGLVNVHISGLDGFSTLGVTLESATPDLLEVMPVGDIGGQPTWELFATAQGLARLVAVDPDGVEADEIHIAVRELSGLVLERLVGDAVGPLVHDEYDEHWIVNAGERVVLMVTPVIDDVPTMGRYTYAPYLESEDLNLYVNDTSVLSKGQLDIEPPAGQYVVHFYDNYDHSLSVLVEAR